MRPLHLGDLFSVSSGLPNTRLEETSVVTKDHSSPDPEEKVLAIAVTTRSLDDDGLLRIANDSTVLVEPGAKNLESKFLRANDVLIGLRGTTFKVVRVTKRDLQSNEAMRLIPDSNVGILRPVRRPRREQDDELHREETLSYLLLGWLKAPGTLETLARRRARGAFSIRITDLNQLELPPLFRTLETPEAHWAAELIADAEKSYWLNLEIAGVRRQLAYEATRLKFNEGGA